MSVKTEHVWDRWPTDEELAALVIDPVTAQDQHGHQYQPLHWDGKLAMICTCCDKDFREGGWYSHAPQGRELYRILVCPEHAMVRTLMDADEEMEVGV